MKVSVETSVRFARFVLAVGQTWRFRSADDPAGPVRFPADPIIGACWHEHLLGFALAAQGRGVASLASLHTDGEIISRAVSRLGWVMARGSSSRGGSSGLRGLLRAAGAGRSVYVTVDGPRGPRHRCQPGVLRLAALTGHPVVPMALAATAGLRMRSWDRFLVPAPGARIFVGYGEPIYVERDLEDEELLMERLEKAIGIETARCEALAREARSGPVYGIRGIGAEKTARGRAKGGGALARRVEGRVRRAWLTPSPPPDLRVASVGFTGARSVREGLYRLGVIERKTAPIPVVSIGGLTVGGSGKTPIASAVAGWTIDAGHRPAILTRGYPDEMRLHRHLQPEATVLGHPDRFTIASRAAAGGSTVAILDDGFQHRRLNRDLDILAIDRDALRRTNGLALPAGPFRESVTDGLRRADAFVLVGREPWTDEVAEFETAWVRQHVPGHAVASLVIESGAPEPVRPGEGSGPTIALTGVMKPNLFFDFVRRMCPTVAREHALPDHGHPGGEWAGLLRDASAGGFVMTWKDYLRFEADIPDGIGVWVVPERLAWRHGLAKLEARVRDAAGRPPPC